MKLIVKIAVYQLSAYIYNLQHTNIQHKKKGRKRCQEKKKPKAWNNKFITTINKIKFSNNDRSQKIAWSDLIKSKIRNRSSGICKIIKKKWKLIIE